MGPVELVGGVAVLIMAVVRVALLVRPAPGAKLPDPGKLGMPMAGPASMQSAHAALSRRGAAARPKFRT